MCVRERERERERGKHAYGQVKSADSFAAIKKLIGSVGMTNLPHSLSLPTPCQGFLHRLCMIWVWQFPHTVPYSTVIIARKFALITEQTQNPPNSHEHELTKVFFSCLLVRNHKNTVGAIAGKEGVGWLVG